MRLIQRIALALVIIGAINWGLIGLFRFDLVAAIFGGQTAGLSRVVYTLVGLSGLISLTTLFMPDEEVNADVDHKGMNQLRYKTEFGSDMDLDNVSRPSKNDSIDKK